MKKEMELGKIHSAGATLKHTRLALSWNPQGNQGKGKTL